jgi:hypothetical protein
VQQRASSSDQRRGATVGEPDAYSENPRYPTRATNGNARVCGPGIPVLLVVKQNNRGKHNHRPRHIYVSKC